MISATGVLKLDKNNPRLDAVVNGINEVGEGSQFIRPVGSSSYVPCGNTTSVTLDIADSIVYETQADVFATKLEKITERLNSLGK